MGDLGSASPGAVRGVANDAVASVEVTCGAEEEDHVAVAELRTGAELPEEADQFAAVVADRRNCCSTGAAVHEEALQGSRKDNHHLLADLTSDD